MAAVAYILVWMLSGTLPWSGLYKKDMSDEDYRTVVLNKKTEFNTFVQQQLRAKWSPRQVMAYLGLSEEPSSELSTTVIHVKIASRTLILVALCGFQRPCSGWWKLLTISGLAKGQVTPDGVAGSRKLSIALSIKLISKPWTKSTSLLTACCDREASVRCKNVYCLISAQNTQLLFLHAVALLLLLILRKRHDNATKSGQRRIAHFSTSWMSGRSSSAFEIGQVDGHLQSTNTQQSALLNKHNESRAQLTTLNAEPPAAGRSAPTAVAVAADDALLSSSSSSAEAVGERGRPRHETEPLPDFLSLSGEATETTSTAEAAEAASDFLSNLRTLAARPETGAKPQFTASHTHTQARPQSALCLLRGTSEPNSAMDRARLPPGSASVVRLSWRSTSASRLATSRLSMAPLQEKRTPTLDR